MTEFLNSVKNGIDNFDTLVPLLKKICEISEKFSSQKEKDEFSNMLKEVKDLISKYYYKEDEKFKNLNDIIEKCNINYGIFYSMYNGFYHFMQSKIYKANKEFSDVYQLFLKHNLLYPKLDLETIQDKKLFRDILNEKIEKIQQNEKTNSYLKFGPFFSFMATAFKTNNKLKKCQNRNANAYLKSFAQATGNVGTNYALSYVGSFLGSVIPIPVVGSLAGSLVGGYIGDYINSLYDFDC